MLDGKDIVHNYKAPKICIIGPGIVGTATGKAFIARRQSVSFIGKGGQKVQKLRTEGFDAYTWDEITNGKFDFKVEPC